MKYRTREGIKSEDRRERESGKERGNWKLGKRKWGNIKKIGTLKNVKLEIWKICKM